MVTEAHVALCDLKEIYVFCILLSNQFDQRYLLPRADRVASLPSPRTHLPRRALRSLQASGVRRGGSGTAALQGSAASGWVAWAADPDAPLFHLRRSASGPEAGAGRAGGGATVPAAPHPGARTRRPPRAARPCLAGCLRVSPAPPRRLRLWPASLRRGLCPPAAGRPLPVPAGSSPPPLLAPLPRRRRRERAGDERVNSGLFPARRDPEPSRARC